MKLKLSRQRQGQVTNRSEGQPPDGQSLLDRWWVQLLLVGWMLLVVVIYFRLQILRLLEVSQGQ